MKKRVHTFASFISEKKTIEEIESLCEGIEINETVEIDGQIFETSSLNIEVLGKKGNEFRIRVNGQEYGYSEKKDGKFDLNTLIEKFKKIMKFSAGRALIWLKNNAEHTFGGKKFA
jgi:hypothetical protein